MFTAGDNAYESGTLEEYEQCYGPTWGRHKDRTRPATGNHEYALGNADGHFQYFGEAAGNPGAGYYSFDLGTWHVIVLDTGDHCDIVDCAVGSAQEQWLREDLAASQAFCTMAIWHDPLFTSGAEHKQRALSSPSMAGALRIRRGCGCEWARTQLRAIRPADP